MEEEFSINKTSIILFTIFALLLVIAFFVALTSKEHVKGYMGRYISSADIDSATMDRLKEFNITTNGKINYELILKNDETFLLYIESSDKLMYYGELSRSFNKYTLNIYREYEIDNNCFKYKKDTIDFKHKNSTLITNEITDKELSFIKYDENISKYDDILKNCSYECGRPIDY
jgi:hypothetical protein